MTKRKVQLIVLCEDKQQFNLARRVFIEWGFDNHQVRGVISPTGKGSGEQFVRRNYPLELQDLDLSLLCADFVGLWL